MYYQLSKYSHHKDSLKVLEADIQHANNLAAEIPEAKGGTHIQMKLACNNLTPLLLFLLQWFDCSCLLPSYLSLFHVLIYKAYTDKGRVISTHGRKASIKDFYAVILPSLQRLHDNLEEVKGFFEEVHLSQQTSAKKIEDKDIIQCSADFEREDECGICLEPCTKMVLPNCCHEMCIKCYRNWNTKSLPCPFCRGSIKRVNSEDLWVLTCTEDIVDTKTISREDLLRFYLYINKLPKSYPDALFLKYYEYLI